MKWLKGSDMYSKPISNQTVKEKNSLPNKGTMSVSNRKSARVSLENNPQLRAFLQPKVRFPLAYFAVAGEKFRHRKILLVVFWRHQQQKFKQKL